MLERGGRVRRCGGGIATIRRSTWGSPVPGGALPAVAGATSPVRGRAPPRRRFPVQDLLGLSGEFLSGQFDCPLSSAALAPHRDRYHLCRVTREVLLPLPAASVAFDSVCPQPPRTKASESCLFRVPAIKSMLEGPGRCQAVRLCPLDGWMAPLPGWGTVP